MANEEHLALLKRGVQGWNEWRGENALTEPDLSEADLSGADLSGANLSRANLWRANLSEANLSGAYLSEAHLGRADLSGAYLSEASLSWVDLIGAHLSEANLRRADIREANLLGANLSGAELGRAYLFGANLRRADLRGADLTGAILTGAQLIETNLTNANLTGCHIYGISAWDLTLKGTTQRDLIITNDNEPEITVDNLEVAQLIYLLLHNEKIRNVIDTLGKKAVLILGRFTPERKPGLDAIRDALRNYNYLPVMFDFQKPESQDFIQPVSTLAHLSRFVIADVTDPKIVLEELPHIVRNIPIPVIPLLLEGSLPEPSTLLNLRVNHLSVLPTYWYPSPESLLASLKEKVIDPAEAKVEELLERKIKLLSSR